MANGLLLAKNRKALFDHIVLETFSAGIKLKGYEVKAVREGSVSFEGSYVIRSGDHLEVLNLFIGRYSKQSKDFNETDAKRSRVLLLNKQEIEKVSAEIAEKGRTAVPLALVLKNNIIKLEFAVVKGKKDYEKKVVAKERQIARDLARDSKEFHQANFSK